MKPNRIEIFDLVKVLLSFLVVNLHVESFITHAPFTPIYFLGWYAVPIFITLTFYFASKYYLNSKFPLKTFIEKISRYTVPFIFWSIVGFLIHTDLFTLKYVLRQLITGTSVDPPLYYLLTLIIISIFIYTFRFLFLSKKWMITITILFLLVIESTGIENMIAQRIPIQIQLSSIRIFEFLKYGLLGLSVGSFAMYLSSKVNKFWIVLITFSITVIDIWWKWHFQASNLGYGGVVQFSIVSLIMIVLILSQNIKLSKWFYNLIKIVSTYSLGIYCIHTFYIELAPSDLKGGWIISISIFILSLSTAIIIDKISFNKLKILVS